MKKALIIRLTSLGDVIFTLPLVNTLKDSGEFSQIDYLVAEKGLGVIKNNPSINKVHFVPLKEWKKHPFSIKKIKEFWQIIKDLRAEKYDIAIDCQQMFKSLFLFAFCGAKRRITFSDARELSVFAGNEFLKPKTNFRDFNYHIVERNLDFARHLEINPEVKFSLPETSEDSKAKIDRLLANIDNSKPIVVISPATTWKNKHWDEKNWAEIVEQIYKICNLVFTGMKSDNTLLHRILSYTNEEISYTNLMGETNLEELIEVFKRARLVISPDSGSAHLAWASQKPYVIAIFTCTPPLRFGPYDENGKKYFSVSEKILSEAENCEVSCQPCFKKKCRFRNERKNICTKYPKSGKIMKIVNSILN